MSEKQYQVDHLEANGNFDRSWRDEKWGDRSLSVAAQDTTNDEKEMTVMQAIKASKAAIFWSLVISTCVIMEGYDTNLLGNFYAYPSFQKKYGSYVGVTKQTPSGYSLTAGWQSGLGQSSGCGSILGTILNGWLVTAFGPRKVVLCTLLVMSCFLFIVFFAPNKPVLLVGELLLGFEWGIVSFTHLPIVNRRQLTDLLPLVRHHCSGVRFGGPSSSTPSVLHLIHKYVLHHWAVHLRRCPSWACRPDRSVGISYSLCPPVVLARNPYSSYLLRSRISVAPGPT